MGLTITKKSTIKTHSGVKPKLMRAEKTKIMRVKKKKIKTKPTGGGW